MLLISNGCGGSEEEGAGNHCRDERETEEKERMFRQAGAVACSNCIGIGAGAELLALEDCHTGHWLRVVMHLVAVVGEREVMVQWRGGSESGSIIEYSTSAIEVGGSQLLTIGIP